MYASAASPQFRRSLTDALTAAGPPLLFGLRLWASEQVLPSCCRFGDNVLESWREDGISVVARKSKSKFDPEAFLAKADGGLPHDL
jgi:hypothetical protein